MTLQTLSLSLNLKTRLSQGHPWVYRNQLGDAANLRLPGGSWIQVRCGNFKSYGLWDASGPIAVRLFSTRQVPDYAWVLERVALAWQNRSPLREQQTGPDRTEAYRLIFGEGDGLPGITVDLYGQYAVVATYSDSVEVLKGWVVEALQATVPLKGILQRTHRKAANTELEEAPVGRAAAETPGKIQTLWGRLPPRQLVVEEHGLKFQANLFEGQKTGLFLDHRENRHYLEKWSANLEVLNCFAYTGAFSVYAARGGAKQVVSVDVAPAAMETAAENFRINGLDPAQHEFLAEDCFELLARYGKEGRKFDLVILDPPSFAHSKKQVFSALRGYTRLNQLALSLLEPGGLLASASCTSYVSPDMFRDMLATAASNAGKRLQTIHEAGQPLDHPVPAHFMEGRYLKFTLNRVQAVP
ncbi:MAG TPA: class I SAM-dependent rRNA methyltransferase [Chloroflexia bacterium]|nr:class I SAM-dependent rRNA methyltransferase [Chloroflexia bacterium]